MNETQVIQGVVLITNHEAPEAAQLGEEPLHLPSPPVAAQRAAILRLGPSAVAAVGSGHRNPQLRERRIQRVGIMAAIADQSAREVVEEAGVKGRRSRSDEDNLARRSRGGRDDTRGETMTSTVCHRPSGQELCTFAPLGRSLPSHAAASFWATTKVPSVQHSERSSLPRAFKSWARASRIRSYVPSRTQRWKRRWQVWYGGYRSGKLANWAPVRKIHKSPFNTSRLLRKGHLRPSARLGHSLISGSSTLHSIVRSSRPWSLYPPMGRSLPSIYEIASSTPRLQFACHALGKSTSRS